MVDVTREPRETRKFSWAFLALFIIALIGALNWGLIGFFNFNLIDAIFGGGSSEMTSTFSRVIYALVGLAGIAALALLPRIRSGYLGHPRGA